MKNHLVRGVGLALALALMTMAAGAQRRPGGDPGRDPDRDWCKAAGIRCLFSRAAGCEVECAQGRTAICIGASCILGFPVSAECTCQ